VSAVIWMLLCPRRSETTFSGVPLAAVLVALASSQAPPDLIAFGLAEASRRRTDRFGANNAHLDRDPDTLERQGHAVAAAA
jgi:hypothetical protein